LRLRACEVNLYLVLDAAASNNFLFFKCFLKTGTSLRHIKITHRALFSKIQQTTDTYHSMTLKILSTHAFDTGIAIIQHRLRQSQRQPRRQVATHAEADTMTDTDSDTYSIAGRDLER